MVHALRVPRALAALALLLSCSGCSGAFAAGPPARFDRRSCAEDALHRHPDPALAREARMLSSASCQKGDAAACSMLGVIHELGLGVPKDRSRARALYQGACSARYQRACGNLGELLLGDPAVGDKLPGSRPVDPIALLRAACDAGSGRHCGVLGRAYATGTGVARALQAAASFSELACGRGDAASCVRLVDLGTDRARRTALLTMACMGGDEDGCAGLTGGERRRGSASLALGAREP
jgi:TPR repeat protein